MKFLNDGSFIALTVLFMCIGILVVYNLYNSYMTKYRIKRLVDIQLDTNKKVTDLCKMLNKLCNMTHHDSFNHDLKLNNDTLVIDDVEKVDTK